MENMDRNNKEKSLFAEWAKNSQGDYFMSVQDTGSYFVKRVQTEYIREYSLETVPELRDELEALWDGDKNMETVLTPVLAAAIKNKPRGQESAGTAENISKVSETKEELPMYIYNF